MKLNEHQVLPLARISRPTLHRKVNAGLFPAPERPDGWHLVWDESSVLAWRRREDASAELKSLRRRVAGMVADDPEVPAIHRRIAELLETLAEVRHG